MADLRNWFDGNFGVGLPKIEVVLKGLDLDELLTVLGAKGLSAVAVGLSLGAPPLVLICFCGLRGLDRDSLPLSSEEPSMKSGSLLATDPFSASVISSTRPCACAWLALRPLMTAGNVRPSRLISARTLEKFCFRRGF